MSRICRRSQTDLGSSTSEEYIILSPEILIFCDLELTVHSYISNSSDFLSQPFQSCLSEPEYPEDSICAFTVLL